MSEQEFTPDTMAVRDVYVRAMRNAFVRSAGEHGEEFDRWLEEHDADVASRMKLRILSEVHGIPSYGTSPRDNHFDLPGEADKTVVMDAIRATKLPEAAA